MWFKVWLLYPCTCSPSGCHSKRIELHSYSFSLPLLLNRFQTGTSTSNDYILSNGNAKYLLQNIRSPKELFSFILSKLHYQMLDIRDHGNVTDIIPSFLIVFERLNNSHLSLPSRPTYILLLPVGALDLIKCLLGYFSPELQIGSNCGKSDLTNHLNLCGLDIRILGKTKLN